MGDIFKDCLIYINPSGFGKNRLALFAKQIKENRGTYLSQLDAKSLSSVTHVVVESENAKDIAKELLDQYKDLSSKNLVILKINWIIDCLKAKSRIDETPYKITTIPRASKRQPDGENFSAPSTSKPKLTVDVDINAFACAHPSPKVSSSDKPQFQIPNQQILDELKKLGDAFKAKGDTWRAYAYTKAISAIKTYNKEIISYDEAISIPGLGDGMASKIWEMLETGHLRRTQEICETEDAKVLELFTGVWGAGPKTAQQWYSLGYRTLEDLKTKATLTSQQKIGLKHYDDIQSKIPREEVIMIAKIVEKEAKIMFPNLQVEVCGSYRRGKPMCGDIDIVMSHPAKDVCKSTVLLLPLVTKLKVMGFITDSLVKIEEEGNHKKFFGLCRLPGEGRRHRRLDLFVIPWNERGPALLHYTGSALFNRSIRLLAQKKDMSLTQHALHGVAIRNGREKVATGEPLYTPTEESVFEHLGLPYRPPEDRDH